MVTVGVRELKSRLSQYIQLARSGEDVQITDHNEVVAELRGPGQPVAESAMEMVLSDLASKGKLVRAKRRPAILPVREQRRTKVKQSDWWAIYQDSKEGKG